jgi:hypothetical protein
MKQLLKKRAFASCFELLFKFFPSRFTFNYVCPIGYWLLSIGYSLY